MIALRFDQLARMTGGTLYNSDNVARMFTGVSIDSRTVEPGELFVAIHGEKQDGHQFIDQAILKGATGIISENAWPGIATVPRDVPVVAVDNSHEAMMQLAEKYRKDISARIVGITGSNGKTTTKELTYSLIKAVEPRSYRSSGNWNNLFGLPLAIFNMPSDTRMAVMELGISQPGEMTRLARIVCPDVIVITNVGPSHLEFLGSVEGVARAKLEMVTVSAKTVLVIVNADDEVLMREASLLRNDLITFGIQNKADFMPDSIEANDHGLTIVIENNTFNLRLFGEYQVYNLLAAYAAARALGVNMSSVDTAGLSFQTAPMRGERRTLNGVRFIIDCYNANPDSVKAALDAFVNENTTGRKVAILGDMLELGRQAESYHRQMGEWLASTDIDMVLLVGPLSELAKETAIEAGMDETSIIHLESVDTAAKHAAANLIQNDLVLVKASRGLGLEKIIDLFEKSGGSR